MTLSFDSCVTKLFFCHIFLVFSTLISAQRQVSPPPNWKARRNSGRLFDLRFSFLQSSLRYTGSGMSPRREPDQTLCEVHARSPAPRILLVCPTMSKNDWVWKRLNKSLSDFNKLFHFRLVWQSMKFDKQDQIPFCCSIFLPLHVSR